MMLGMDQVMNELVKRKALNYLAYPDKHYSIYQHRKTILSYYPGCIKSDDFITIRSIFGLNVFEILELIKILFK